MKSFRFLLVVPFLVGCSFAEREFSPSGPVRLIVAESFNKEGWGAFWDRVETRHDPSHYSPYTGAKKFVNAPGSNQGYAAHYFIMEGTDEKTPFSIGMKNISPEVEEFYVEWREYFVPGYSWPINQKMFRFTRDGGGGVRDGVEVNLGAGDYNSNIQVSAFSLSNNMFPFRNTGRAVPEGRWVKFAVWGKLNDPGKSNGFVRAWMDDRLLASLEYLFFGETGGNKWNELWIGGNYSNQGPLKGNGSRYIDDIKWYNTYPLRNLEKTGSE